MSQLSPLEIGIIILVIFLLFGPKRIPELGRAIGKGIREFKQSISGVTDEQPTKTDETIKPVKK